MNKTTHHEASSSGMNKIFAAIFVGVAVLIGGYVLDKMHVLSATGNTEQAADLAVPAGAQEVAMTVTTGGYLPNQLTIKAGQPVAWKVDGTNAIGCTKILTIPSLGVRQSLSKGENIIQFTAPSQPGPLAFMCSMGMVRGTFNVI